MAGGGGGASEELFDNDRCVVLPSVVPGIQSVDLIARGHGSPSGCCEASNQYSSIVTNTSKMRIGLGQISRESVVSAVT